MSGKTETDQLRRRIETLRLKHPKPGGRFAWGVNTAQMEISILRGVRRPDGSDETET
jgi:hypothetical protein